MAAVTICSHLDFGAQRNKVCHCFHSFPIYLPWSDEMGEFNSDDHYIYYCGQESLRRNGVAITVNKSLKYSTWMQSQKWQMISVHLEGKPFKITAYAPTSNAEEAEVERFYEDLKDLLEPTLKKDILFFIGNWIEKVGSQKTLRVTGKFGLEIWNEVGQRLIEFCQENALLIANTLFQKHEKTLHMDITRWSTLKSDWLYSLQPKMEKLYTVSKKKMRSWLWLRSWTPYCQIQI